METMERKMLKHWLWKVASDIAVLADILDGVVPEGWTPEDADSGPAEPAENPVTCEMIRAVLHEKRAAGFREETLQLLRGHGLKKLSEAEGNPELLRTLCREAKEIGK